MLLPIRSRRCLFLLVCPRVSSRLVSWVGYRLLQRKAPGVPLQSARAPERIVLAPLIAGASDPRQGWTDLLRLLCADAQGPPCFLGFSVLLLSPYGPSSFLHARGSLFRV